MPKALYSGVLPIAFAPLPALAATFGNYSGDSTPVGVLVPNFSYGVTAPGPGQLVGATTFLHLWNNRWNFYTVVNTSGGPNPLSNNTTGAIMNGRLITSGSDSGGHVFVNDAPLQTTFNDASYSLTNLAVSLGPLGTDDGNTWNPMLVTLAPGDVSYGMNSDAPFGFGGSSTLFLYAPALLGTAAPGVNLAFGGGHESNRYNAVDVVNGVNYTYNDGVLRIWRYNRATNTALYSMLNEAVTIGAPGTGIAAVSKATPFGFLFTDATLGLCVADLGWQHYWQLQATAPVGLFPWTFDALGIAYAAGHDGVVYSSGTPYTSSASGGSGTIPSSASGGSGTIPAGGAPAFPLGGAAGSSGVDPQIILQASNDGGRTWGSERATSLGKIGDYRRLVRWRRNGRSNNRAFRVVCSAPVRVALIECDLDSHD